MIRSVIIALTLAAGTTVAFADPAAIEARQKEMKGFGAAAGTMGKMLKGDTAFDLAKAKEALGVLSEGSKKLPGLFPADSKEGKTEALPIIWEKKADFDAVAAKIGADATAAATKITDEASFKAEVPKVLSNCGTCHTTFRAKK